MFVLLLLTVTSGVGIYKQKKVITDLTVEMDIYMVNAPNESAEKSETGFSEKIEAKADEISRSSAMHHILGNVDKKINDMNKCSRCK